MGLDTILAIAGGFATIFFGVLSIRLMNRHRYPGEITVVEEQSIAIFDEIVKNLPDLAVLYKNSPVNPNVVLITMALVNTGKKDISPAMVEHPICLRLPENFKWISANVIGTSHGISVTIAHTNSFSINVIPSLFRCNEFIRIQALIEVPNIKDFHINYANVFIFFRQVLSIDHRIQDTRRVKKVELNYSLYKDKHRFALASTPLLFGILMVISLIITNRWYDLNNYLAYNFRNQSNSTIIVTASLNKKNNLDVKAIKGNYREEIPVKQFFSRTEGIPTVITVKTSSIQPIVIFSTLLLLIPLSFTIFNYYHFKPTRRIRSLLYKQ